MHKFKNKPNSKISESPNHELPLGTIVDVWFEDKTKYFRGKIISFEEEADTYTILFHSTKNTITLSHENCTDGKVEVSDDADRWNLVESNT